MYAFNWKRAVERYSDELSEIVAELIVMAGLQGVDFVDTLPRRLYFRILSILRPAEYAARRIILMAACKLEWNIRIVERKKEATPAERHPHLAPWGSEGRVETSARSESEGQGHRVPAFDLFDPAKDYGKFFLSDAEYAALMKAREEARYLPTPYHSPDEPVNAISLSRRIRALADAMQNIDRQAIRLARWKARHMPNGTRAGAVGLKHTSLRSLSSRTPTSSRSGLSPIRFSRSAGRAPPPCLARAGALRARPVLRIVERAVGQRQAAAADAFVEPVAQLGQRLDLAVEFGAKVSPILVQSALFGVRPFGSRSSTCLICGRVKPNCWAIITKDRRLMSERRKRRWPPALRSGAISPCSS
jgi:hypothetical protein